MLHVGARVAVRCRPMIGEGLRCPDRPHLSIGNTALNGDGPASCYLPEAGPPARCDTGATGDPAQTCVRT
jgi:hypothetical protein